MPGTLRSAWSRVVTFCCSSTSRGTTLMVCGVSWTVPGSRDTPVPRRRVLAGSAPVTSTTGSSSAGAWAEEPWAEEPWAGEPWAVVAGWAWATAESATARPAVMANWDTVQ